MRKMNMTLEKIVCLHQFFNHKGNYQSKTHGNCSVCQYDPLNNPICSGYYPIKERILIVKENGTHEGKYK